MKRFRVAMTCLAAVMLLSQAAMADVQPGQVVNKDNVQSIQGLVPEFLYNLVKDGKMEMKIGQLGFNKKEFVLPSVKDNLQANKGKYGLSPQNDLIEVASGKKYPKVVGLPFPDLDPSDPQWGFKAMYNWRMLDQSTGNCLTMNSLLDVDSGKVTRECIQEQVYFRPGAKDPMNEYDWVFAGVYRKPYDVSGLATLDMRTINPDASSVRYNYLPGMRKMRRMPADTPTSETFFGWSFAEDDTSLGGPYYQIRDCDYKVVGVKEMLVPYLSEKPKTLTKDQNGNAMFEVKKPEDGIILAAAAGKSDLADWVPTNIVWVKAKVVELEFTAKNIKGYQYGTSKAWIDADTGRPAYKFLNKAGGGKPMKIVLHVHGAYATPDNSIKYLDYAGVVAKELDRNHATMICRLALPGNKMVLNVGDKIDMGLFTKEGFARFTQ